jgi:hypothetical protein
MAWRKPFCGVAEVASPKLTRRTFMGEMHRHRLFADGRGARPRTRRRDVAEG